MIKILIHAHLIHALMVVIAVFLERIIILAVVNLDIPGSIAIFVNFKIKK